MQLYNNNKIKKHLLGNCIFFLNKKSRITVETGAVLKVHEYNSPLPGSVYG